MESFRDKIEKDNKIKKLNDNDKLNALNNEKIKNQKFLNSLENETILKVIHDDYIDSNNGKKYVS